MGTEVLDNRVALVLDELGYRPSTRPGHNSAMDILNNKDHCKEFLHRLGKEGGTATTERVLREALNWPTEKEKEKPMANKTGVVAHLKLICKKGATMTEIVESLTKEFPDREPDKMKSTVRTQLGGRLASTGFTVTKVKDDKRGIIYTIA